MAISRRRVRESMFRVSPRLVELRTSTAVVRRSYNVESSNALWHIDGLHCLVRWRIIIHDGIDGYSRRLCTSTTRYLSIFWLHQKAMVGPLEFGRIMVGKILKLREPCCYAGVWEERATLLVPVSTTSALSACGVMFSLVLGILTTTYFMKWRIAVCWTH